MIKITIDSQIHGVVWLLKPSQEEVDAYIEWCHQSEHWGKPAYTEVIPAVLDENQIEITPEQTIEHEAEYSVVVEDISAQVEQEKINAEALAYLAETDWMAIREAEGGTSMPAEIKVERQSARNRIIR